MGPASETGIFTRIQDGSSVTTNIGPSAFPIIEASEVLITSGNQAIYWCIPTAGTQRRFVSTNGTTFTSAPFTTPISTNYCPSQVAQFSNGDLYAMQYGTRGNSGGSSTDLYSTDLGVTWTLPAVLPGGGQSVDLININGTVYVAKSFNRGVWSSTDGATWTPIYSPFSPTSLFELGGNLWGCNGTSFVQLTSS